MKNCRLLFPLFFFLACLNIVRAQKDTEFWFVAPEISAGDPIYDQPVAFRFSTYGAPAVVTVSQPANPAFPAQVISLPANSGGTLQFPPFFNTVENTPSDQVLNRGFLIESTAPITAYYEIIGQSPNNPELFSLKGKNALGTFFYVPFQTETPNSNAYNPLPHAAFDIVATEDNTTVTITPTAALVGHAANIPFAVILDRGETYSAEALSQSAAGHPAGSKVIADKPVAITVKDDLLEGSTLFSGFCRDVMGDQIIPVERAGTRYVAHKGFMNANERAYVLATADGTQVSLDGVVQTTNLNAGQTRILEITDGSHFIEASAPVYVLQLSGVNCEIAGEILPSLDCSGSTAVRFVRSTDEEFYMILVTRSGNQGGFSLNGNNLLVPAAAFQTVPGSNGEFVAAILPYSNFSVPAGQSSVIENALGVFQMGFLNGGLTTGCRFGYFSDFGSKVDIDNEIVFCPGESVTIDGVTYDQPTTFSDTIPGITGCDTIINYALKFAPVDFTFRMDGFVCNNGRIDLHYTVCNLGSGPVPQEVSVTFYDADPTALAASILATYTIGTAGLDSCAAGVLEDVGDQMFPDDVPPGTVVFSVVNFDGSLPTPFSFGDFPVTDVEECNYENNLDDLPVQLPASPLLDLGPDVVLCVDSTVVFDAGPGFVEYLWQDGSTSQTFAATDFDVYWVVATDSCGYKQVDSVLLTGNLLPDTQFPDVDICAGESLFLTLPGFDNYAWGPAAGLSCTNCPDVTIQPAETTTYTLLATTNDGCVLNDTFTITVIPLPTYTEAISFCPGESVTIGGTTYTQSATVTETLPASGIGCDTVATYILTLLAQPATTQTVAFCEGDTVFIGGTAYTQPGTVKDTLPAAAGCDTIATYILQYITAPNSSVSIDCIDDIDIATQPGTGPVVVDYDLPTYSSDCPCPGTALTLTAGLPPGSAFPLGETEVCYEVNDSCGNTASCCFTVHIREALPCDVKTIGCMKYELLGITINAKLEKTYRIRVTNNCPNPMTYAAIQLPDGVTAVKPPHLSVFTTQDGRDYEVRNPNFSPFYSVRFKSTTDSIANGESDVFLYTLPPQSTPAYIHITARLEPQVFYEAHLNTFNCPVLPDDDMKPSADRGNAGSLSRLQVFPNPTNGELYADLSPWRGQQVSIQVIDSRGVIVHTLRETAEAAPQAIRISAGLPGGLYVLDLLTADGQRQAVRFVLQR